MHHTSTETVLRCTGLRRSFGDLVAVEDVGFEVRAGETYGLLGPNGAGKTTTISMLAGLLHPDAGEVTVAGEPIGPRHTDARRHVGLVPQDLAIYPDLTARENLAFFGRLQGLTGAELRGRVDEVLEVTGLTDRADDRTDEYSGGMKRRCNIGIGLLHRPRLLVLDEPTVGVDPQSRDAILAAVEALAGEGMAVLYTTHYMEEAERLCDRVGIIDRGRLQAEGTRPELVATLGQLDTVTVDATGATDAAADALRRLDGVADVSTSDAGLVVTVADAGGRLGALLAEATAAGAQVRAVRVDEPDLEAVFLHLTGRALRD
ncbi:MAG: ABC transporter ATP-binding protein [Actinomycetes bacterium]